MAVAMSCSQPDPDQIDRLSSLPDELLVTILSFLPTPIAGRTSVLSRRFRHLWQAIPSVQLISGSRKKDRDKFIAMADYVVLNRNISHPLLSLRLKFNSSFYGYPSLSDSYIPSLLAKAHSLGLRNLTIEGFIDLVPILPTIFSINSLESLSLESGFYPHPGPYHILPSGFTLTCLRNLSLELDNVEPASLSQLVSELCSLEDLHFSASTMDRLSLSSRTMKRLELIIRIDHSQLHTLELFLPSLESLHLDRFNSFSSLSSRFNIHAEFPLLKRASITLITVEGKDVNAISELLNSFVHVEELTLSVEESEFVKCPEPILLQPGKGLPKFPNLKHLDASLCFHEHNFEAITMVLHNSPALESLKLVHEIRKFTGVSRGRKRKDWRSKLPRNADGNYRYAYFRNLHLGENRKEFMKLLGKKCSSKKHAKS
ncbi:FBD-associated F-box protein [Rhynchospora pubera]|uniref:FBD-associated F-box protein n=1 Tax=Rhynchospora pubera TaxID=906938 RepID=A0AAV8GR29_9POAL|nr:FBD-associated F-box protein [Rhynchospora pubera]